MLSRLRDQPRSLEEVRLSLGLDNAKQSCHHLSDVRKQARQTRSARSPGETALTSAMRSVIYITWTYHMTSLSLAHCMASPSQGAVRRLKGVGSYAVGMHDHGSIMERRTFALHICSSLTCSQSRIGLDRRTHTANHACSLGANVYTLQFATQTEGHRCPLQW